MEAVMEIADMLVMKVVLMVTLKRMEQVEQAEEMVSETGRGTDQETAQVLAVTYLS
jgi:hypothetical protein